MPYKDWRLGPPTSGGTFPATICDHPSRASNSELEETVHVYPADAF